MSKNADLPAAPTIYADMGTNGQREIFCDNRGLTKREHFAALALQGLLVNAERNGLTFRTCAEEAVRQADMLLAELDK